MNKYLSILEAAIQRSQANTETKRYVIYNIARKALEDFFSRSEVDESDRINSKFLLDAAIQQIETRYQRDSSYAA